VKSVASVPNLQPTWQQAASSYGSSDDLIKELWAELELAYTAKGRHYHNLSHVEYMMALAMEFRHHLQDPETVAFSIFYHDFVYMVTRTDNELKSADAARDRLSSLRVPSEKVARCHRQILATKDHQMSSDSDTNYLLDFDLAILGDTAVKYRDYADKIRREYSVYPDLLYNPGRKKVLQNFLQMGRIFKTDEFHEKYDLRARANIEEELRGI
jgi:predicted metal-dependent HD superfamily phosphohydrolase